MRRADAHWQSGKFSGVKQTLANACKRLQMLTARIIALKGFSFAVSMVGSADRKAPINPSTQHIMNMNNKVQLIGHLGSDPELKDVGNGKRVLRFRMATNERYKGTDGEWKDITEWHPVVAWGKQAERLAGQVGKGSGLLVEGRLVHRNYETKEGEKRTSSEVVLSDYRLMSAAKGVAA